MINAGQFNKRIKIQYKTEDSFDDEGYAVEGEEYSQSLWAMVKPISAKEYTKEKATQTENITRFVIRYRRNLNVTDEMKIIYKGRTFEIESVINDYENNTTLTIIGREVK